MNQTNWIRTKENRIFRADTLVGFDIRTVPVDMLKMSPKETMGGPRSRNYNIVGIFDVCGKREDFILAADYGSLDQIDDAIKGFVIFLEEAAPAGVFIHEIPSGRNAALRKP